MLLLANEMPALTFILLILSALRKEIPEIIFFAVLLPILQSPPKYFESPKS